MIRPYALRGASAALATVALSGALMAGCRGQVSDKPPIHVVPDMDWQSKYHADGESTFFEDRRANRPLEPGTVAHGSNHDADTTGYWTGRIGEAYVAKAPVEMTENLVRRGQQRFGIFCAPCHAATGAGNGLVVQRGFARPIELYSPHTRVIGDGEIYEYIAKGIRNMPSYGAQIPEQDRWALVAWVRVLQRSQNGDLADVPDNLRNSIEAETP